MARSLTLICNDGQTRLSTRDLMPLVEIPQLARFTVTSDPAAMIALARCRIPPTVWSQEYHTGLRLRLRSQQQSHGKRRWKAGGKAVGRQPPWAN